MEKPAFAPARRAFATIGIAILALYFLPGVAAALLLAFGGVLFGVLLDAMARPLRRRLHLRRGVALAVAILVLLAAIALFAWLAGPQIARQTASMQSQIPNSLAALGDMLRKNDWGSALLAHVSQGSPMEWLPGRIWAGITNIFSTTLEAASAVVFVFILGIYFSASPALYVDGALRIVPAMHRNRCREVMNSLGRALRWWLAGRVITMTLMGLLTTVALVAIHLPAALTLGLIAGLLLFVPYIGALVSAIPALLIASLQGPEKALWVALVYTGVHVFEGYAITPLVQKRAVSLPPALLLVTQIFAGVLFGMLGILFATPLTVVAIVLIQMLYVRDTLGENVSIPGEH